jgi:hypothetical protein
MQQFPHFGDAPEPVSQARMIEAGEGSAMRVDVSMPLCRRQPLQQAKESNHMWLGRYFKPVVRGALGFSHDFCQPGVSY